MIGREILKETEQVFSNIKNVMADFGGTMENIVKTGIHLTDIAHVETFRRVRDKFVCVTNTPASTLVTVSKLFGEAILLKIEADAIIYKMQYRSGK